MAVGVIGRRVEDLNGRDLANRRLIAAAGGREKSGMFSITTYPLRNVAVSRSAPWGSELDRGGGEAGAAGVPH
jgi:hypothetical protein